MNKILVYFPYALKDGKSGSSVRPQKILQAFRDYASLKNLELIEIHGGSKERKEKIANFKVNVNPDEVILCYMENSTLPFWLTDYDHIPRTPFLERSLFKYLKKNNIPLAVFYRDIYWNSDHYTLKGLKKSVMRFIYKNELSLYKKYAKHFFLPSMEMNKFVNFPIEATSSLPPGGEKLLFNQMELTKKTLDIVYVGGISERYGLNEMLEAVSRVNSKHDSAVLHLVCRKEEFEQQKKVVEPYINESWLNVYHLHGEQLIDVYKKADLALIPIQKNLYNDFAVPVKLFEYMSYGLPIVSTDCTAQAKIINEYSLGVVVESSAAGLEHGIEYFMVEENRAAYSENVKKALLEKNLWIHRAENVVSILKNK